jgi:two-component system KDP operon response regulator KdpE
LPDLDGVEVTRLLREWTSLPIIIVSVPGQKADEVAALDAEVDDYFTKPFGVGELLARMRVALRRASLSGSEAVFVTGDLVVDPAGREARVAGWLVQLTPTEYDLLRILVSRTHNSILSPTLRSWAPCSRSTRPCS